MHGIIITVRWERMQLIFTLATYHKAIAYNANAAAIEAALEGLSTIDDVQVSLHGGTQICDNDGASASITFVTNPGDNPPIRIYSTALASTAGTTTAHVNLAVKDNGAASAYAGANSLNGNREFVEW